MALQLVVVNASVVRFYHCPGASALALALGTCVEFGPTQLPVGLGLGPNLIDRKLGGPEPDTSAAH